MGVDGQFDASEESAAGVGGLGLDVDLALGQESDEGGDLGEDGFDSADHDLVGGERAAARKTGIGDDVTQNTGAFAVVGDLLQRLADVVVGAGSEHLVADGNAGKRESGLLQRHLDLDGGNQILHDLGVQFSFDLSGEGDRVLFHCQLIDLHNIATAGFPRESLGGGNGAKENESHNHLHFLRVFFRSDERQKIKIKRIVEM